MSSRETRWAQKRASYLSGVSSSQPAVQLPPPLATFVVDYAASERALATDLRGASAQASYMSAPPPPLAPAVPGGGTWRAPYSQLPPPHPIKDAIDIALGGGAAFRPEYSNTGGGGFSGGGGMGGRTMTREEAWEAKRAQQGRGGGGGGPPPTLTGGYSGMGGGGGGRGIAAAPLPYTQPPQWGMEAGSGDSRASSRGSATGTLSGAGMAQLTGSYPYAQQQQQPGGRYTPQQQHQQPQQHYQQYPSQSHQHHQQPQQQQQHYQQYPPQGRQAPGGRSSGFTFG